MSQPVLRLRAKSRAKFRRTQEDEQLLANEPEHLTEVQKVSVGNLRRRRAANAIETANECQPTSQVRGPDNDNRAGGMGAVAKREMGYRLWAASRAHDALIVRGNIKSEDHPPNGVVRDPPLDVSQSRQSCTG